MAPENAPSTFDAYADDYDAALDRGLAASGEGKEYFASRRVEWLAGRLRSMGISPRTALDYGCGTGSATPFLRETLGIQSLTGVDTSERSLETARRDHGGEQVEFATVAQLGEKGPFDLAYCNGVFHHIPPDERPSAVRAVREALIPGGLFAFWENNPWNPGTRYVMSKIPFDRDAVTLTPPEARRLLASNGFEVVRTDFLFIFPKFLRVLRGLEPLVARAPLGAQYMVLARRPAAGS